MEIPKWGEYVGHQYSESGSVSGIDGNVDTDNFYNNGLMFLSNTNTPRETIQPVQANTDNIYSQLQKLINQQGFGDIVVDGIPGPDTLKHCPVVKEGGRGDITKWIQLRVGFTGDDVDGIFGENTKNAVIGFQSSKGIEADGVIGENTWRALLGL
jgi:peptidoglycan hydrolase-like protein with peptidoglycan-binding domain